MNKETLQGLLGRSISYHLVFARITGKVKAGLMLSQMFYWTGRGSRDGWFYKTQMEWTAETGLSRDEQENVRALLKSLGFLEEKRKGVPGKMHFRLQIESIVRAIERLQFEHGTEAMPNVGEPDSAVRERTDLESSQPPINNALNPQYITESTSEIKTESTSENKKRLLSDSERIYVHYPRKEGRRPALFEIDRALRRLVLGESGSLMSKQQAFEYLTDRTSLYGRSPAGRAGPAPVIGPATPHPSTWYHQSRYMDEERNWYVSRSGGPRNRAAERQEQSINAISTALARRTARSANGDNPGELPEPDLNG
jgi:hypothetical protein